jgi:hypothetical protein
MGLGAVAFSRVSGLPVAFALFALLGALTAPNAVARQLVLQRNTPRELMGRVSGALIVCRNVLFLLGMTAAGLLADRLDVRLLYGALGMVFLVTGLLTLWLRGSDQRRRSPAMTVGAGIAAGD